MSAVLEKVKGDEIQSIREGLTKVGAGMCSLMIAG